MYTVQDKAEIPCKRKLCDNDSDGEHLPELFCMCRSMVVMPILCEMMRGYCECTRCITMERMNVQGDVVDLYHK